MALFRAFTERDDLQKATQCVLEAYIQHCEREWWQAVHGVDVPVAGAEHTHEGTVAWSGARATVHANAGSRVLLAC